FQLTITGDHVGPLAPAIAGGHQRQSNENQERHKGFAHLELACASLATIFRELAASVSDAVARLAAGFQAPPRPPPVVIAVTVQTIVWGQINSGGQAVSESRRRAAIPLRTQPAVR